MGTIVSGRLAWKPTEGDPGDDERRGLKTIICPTTRLISVSRVPARHATRNESPTPLKLRYNRAKTISSWDVIALRKSVSRVLNIWPSHWSNAIKKTRSIDLSKESFGKFLLVEYNLPTNFSTDQNEIEIIFQISLTGFSCERITQYFLFRFAIGIFIADKTSHETSMNRLPSLSFSSFLLRSIEVSKNSGPTGFLSSTKFSSLSSEIKRFSKNSFPFQSCLLLYISTVSKRHRYL